MRLLTFSFLLTLALAAAVFAQSYGDVVITEVMYDDTASTDVEWAEIHNTTAGDIDISGWVLIDDSVYPADGGEGGIRLPAGTMLAAGAYAVLCRQDLPGITGEILCEHYVSSWTLGNSGDNLALYTAATGGILIDGSLVDQYPDLAGTNLGNSIEKCDPNATWTSSPSAWHESTFEFATSGRFRHCTPGAPNSPCVDDIPPTIVSVTVLNNTQLDVLFSEDLDAVSSGEPWHYMVNSGIGNPAGAVRDGGNFALIHLTFAPIPNGTYLLEVAGVMDMFGNEANDSEPFAVAMSVAPGAVVITEVMYDDTATTDAEWIEIHNTTDAAIDISGWIVTDDAAYPPTTEGYWEVPANVMIGPDQYLVLAPADLEGITGEIVVNVPDPSAFGNSGDNIALLTAGGGQIVDGSFTVWYPDLAPGNQGRSIEKCDPNSMWSGNPADWTASQVFFSHTGRYRYCTPGFAGFCCSEPGGTAYITLTQPGPGSWYYTLHHVSGCVSRVVFTNVCPWTAGYTEGAAAAAGWTAVEYGDGNDGDSIIFNGGTALAEGSLAGFVLYHPTCAASVNWSAGDSSGTVDGPLPVELQSFNAAGGDGIVNLAWRTGAEIDNERFELLRDGEWLTIVPAKGSSGSGHDYVWTDRGVVNGTAYTYTLIAVGTDGNRSELATASATPGAGAAVSEYALHQNYPNPFNPSTSIGFDLVEAGEVRLSVYNVVGQEVAQLVNGRRNAGRYTVNFDATDLPSGLYFCKLQTAGFTATQKMVLLK